MRILFISDMHFHNYRAHSEIINGFNSRLMDIAWCVRKAFEIGYENGCSLCVAAGDIFHVRGNVRPSVLSFTAGLFQEMSDLLFPVFMLPGNHDMENYSGGATSIDTLNYIPGVTVGQLPGLFNINGQDIISVPYIHSTDEFKQVFSNLSEKYADENSITVIHQGIDSFASENMPATGISPLWLMEKNPGWIFSGHYHNPAAKNRVVNVGAVCHHNFGDAGSDRGCFIFDTMSKKITFFSLLSYAPEFVLVDSENIPEKSRLTNSIIRINAENKTQAQDLARLAQSAGARSLSVQFNKKFKTTHQHSVSIDKPVKMLSQYIDLNEKYKPFKHQILNLYNEICHE